MAGKRDEHQHNLNSLHSLSTVTIHRLRYHFFFMSKKRTKESTNNKIYFRFISNCALKRLLSTSHGFVFDVRMHLPSHKLLLNQTHPPYASKEFDEMENIMIIIFDQRQKRRFRLFRPRARERRKLWIECGHVTVIWLLAKDWFRWLHIACAHTDVLGQNDKIEKKPQKSETIEPEKTQTNTRRTSTF